MRVAVLGIGLMGGPLARRLLQTGHEVYVYNRTRAKAEALEPEGATVCDRPDEAVRPAEAVVLALSDTDAIRAVLLADEAAVPLAGRCVVQTGTIAPEESRALAETIEEAGGEYLEAPVLGSVPEARDGRLLVMAGAREGVFERWQGLLGVFSQAPMRIGPVGQGAALKLAMNQLIAALTSGFALSLGLVRREGVDVETFMQILRDSALYAPTFDKKLQRMLERHYEAPNFPVKHLGKDISLCLQVAARDGLAPDALKGVAQILGRAAEQSVGELDYSALYDIVDPVR